MVRKGLAAGGGSTVRPAGNAHWYHPDTELHDSREICLHPCNARARRPAHDVRVPSRRVTHECCVLQRWGAGQPSAGCRASGIGHARPPGRQRSPARRHARGASCPLGAVGCSDGARVVVARHAARVAVARHAAQCEPRRRVLRPGRSRAASRATGTTRTSGWRRRGAGRAECVTRTVPERRLPLAGRLAGGVSCPFGAGRSRPDCGRRTCSSVRVETARRAPGTSAHCLSCKRNECRRPERARSREPAPTRRPAGGPQPCAAASASARSRIRCASMSTSWRWISARRSACSCGSARCSCPSSEALRASRSRSTRATTMLRA